MNPTTLNRSPSEISLVSVAENEDSDLVPNFSTILHEVYLYLKKVLKDGDLSKQSSTLLKKIKHKLPLLQAEYTKIANEGAYFSGRADEATKCAEDYKHILHKITSNMPTKDSTAHVIEDTLGHHLANMATLHQEMETLKHNIAEITTIAAKQIQEKPQPPSPPTQQQRQSNNTQSAPANSDNSSDDNFLKHRRTIIMKSRSAPYKSGKEIRNHLCSLNIACPASKIENLSTKRTHLEIICTTQANKETIIRELQANQDLNRTYNFVTKSILKQKMVLLDVPDNYPDAEVTKAITTRYYAHPDDIIHNRHYKLKDTGCSNRILILPIIVAKDIIAAGGLPVGFKRCKMSPYTQITRCRNCQSLKHNERTCPNSASCEKCGESHHTQNCTSTEFACVNCKKSNQHQSTRYTTNHAASDSNCSTYRNSYAQERERLNNIFYPPAPQQDNIEHPPANNSYEYPPFQPSQEARATHTRDSPQNYWFSPRPSYPGNPWFYPNSYF